MKFHKGSFYILRVDGTVELKNGWIDETNTFGFYSLRKKNLKIIWKWVATDIYSGLKITDNKSRIACANWIEDNIDKIMIQTTKVQYERAAQEKRRRIQDGEFY